MVTPPETSTGESTPEEGRSTGARYSVADLLARTDAMLRSGRAPGATVWPTGFDRLDRVLRGGVRSGELVLIAGSQGQGKTTCGLQMLRAAVASGQSAVFFSYEHESHTLLERLLAMEAAHAGQADPEGIAPADVGRFRRVFEDVEGGSRTLEEALSGLAHAPAALEAVVGYGPRLHIHESTPSTDVRVMREVLDSVTQETGKAPLVLVDYLQKVPGVGIDDDARISRVVESLKDLALDRGVPVVAISAAEKEHLGAGHRMRAQHLRGSSALAYESDVVLVLADKADIVSREHLVYDLSSQERFRQWTVITVEKNRHGEDHIELEFQKDFAHGRFLPNGREVHERLIEERVFTT